MKNNILKDMGFRRNWIYETIVATYSGGKGHAAAMGVSTGDMENIALEAYKSAETCVNIRERKSFTVNFTCDINLFYRSLYEKNGISYARADKVNAPFLKDADRFLEISVIKEEDLGDRMRFTGKIGSCGGSDSIRLVNRADSLALECMIKASKIPYASPVEKERLKEEITYISRAVSRTAPGSDAARVCDAILSSL
ncbi:MAG: DUF447 family protein [Candidatus Altiarchaeota archaeon]|nr:DUF447 family protein [Candidatus Altiarchaeota archaeon]